MRVKRQTLIYFVLLFVALLLPGFIKFADAQSVWIAGDGVWSEPANWDPAGVPDGVNAMLVAEQEDFTVTYNSNAATVASIELSNKPTGNTVTLMVTNGVSLNVSGEIETLSSGGGRITVATGSSLNAGTLKLSGSGNVAAAGKAYVQGELSTASLGIYDKNSLLHLAEGAFVTNSGSLTIQGGGTDGSYATLDTAGVIYTKSLTVGRARSGAVGASGMMTMHGGVVRSGGVGIAYAGNGGSSTGIFKVEGGSVVNSGTLQMGGNSYNGMSATLLIDAGTWTNNYTGNSLLATANYEGTSSKTAMLTVTNGGRFIAYGDLTCAQIGNKKVGNVKVTATINVLNGSRFETYGNNFKLGTLSRGTADGAEALATLNVSNAVFCATNSNCSGTVMLGHLIEETETFTNVTATGRINLYSGSILIDRLEATYGEYSVIDLRGGLLEVGEAVLTDCDLRTRLAGNTAQDDYGLIRSSTAPDIGEGATTLSITLDYAPASGECFTVIDNTSDDPVDGYFADDFVCADFGGRTYTFDVLYTAGDGNDVVLRETTPTRTLLFVK
jgi:hypothetical protein